MSSTSRPFGPGRAHPASGRRHVRPPGPLPTAPGAELTPEHIDGLLTVLGGLDIGSLVVVAPDRPGHMILGVSELPSDPRCAGAGLFGLDVPAGCSLVGASFAGRSSSRRGDDLSVGVGRATDADADQEEAGSTRVDALVTALGGVHARVRHDDGPPQPVLGRPSGVMIDALHRAMHLPAPGSPPPLTELVTRMWLHQVLGLASSAPSWTEAAAAHLDHGRVASGDESRAVEPTVDDVVVSILELADEADWHDLHRAAVIGRMAVPELVPEEAGWMDHTMFARWMADSFRSTDAAVAILRSRGAAAVDRIVDVLDHITDATTMLRRQGRGA